MRYFGSSPLHNSAELLFRCRRIFLIAILLGVAAAVVLVRLRSTTYTASIIVSLAGDVDPVRDDRAVVAKRRADRLSFWLRKDPNFLVTTLKDAGVLKKHPNVDPDDFLHRLRTAMTSPVMGSDVYMEVGVAWPDKSEAEAIMREVYQGFQRETVRAETIGVSARRQFFDDQLKAQNAAARKKAMERAAYLQSHYWRGPAVVGVSLSQSDKTEDSLISAKRDLSEAEARLSGIEKELAATTPEVRIQRKKKSTVDPAAALVAERDEVQRNLDKLLVRYEEQHPAVISARNLIKTLNKDIDEKRRTSTPPTETTEEVKPNPRYQELQRLKTQFASTVAGLSGRVAQLQRLLDDRKLAARQAPSEEVKFNEIQRDFRMADELRNQTAQQLASAKQTEQLEKAVRTQSIDLVSKPRAERLDSGPKTAFIYVLGPLAGFVLACGLSILSGSLDRSIRTPADVERSLGKPVLAVLPNIKKKKERDRLLPGEDNRRLGS